jgi:hypothetical protein
MKSRQFVIAALAVFLPLTLQPAFATAKLVTMYKYKYKYKYKGCECCDKWAKRLEASGFTVKTEFRDDLTPIKRQAGVPQELGSCHTALIDGYAFEGHVPADLVAKVLKDKPKIAGLAVPGMPLGSPGMEAPSGQKQPYRVMAFSRDAAPTIYAQR